ncbi:YbaB/EbfC family nucleoid-associated protein [Actinopolymorpha pittospori]
MTGFGIPELDRQLDQLLESASKLTDMQARVAEIHGQGEAIDGKVLVETDNAGRLVKVELDPRVMRLPSTELAEAFLAAAQQASDDVARQSSELMNEFMPAQAPSIDKLLRTDYSGLRDDAAEAIKRISQSTNPIAELKEQLGRLTPGATPKPPTSDSTP